MTGSCARCWQPGRCVSMVLALMVAGVRLTYLDLFSSVRFVFFALGFGHVVVKNEQGVVCDQRDDGHRILVSCRGKVD